MKSLNNLLTVLLFLAVLGALLRGAYIAFWWLVHLFRGLDAQVSSVIYAAVITVLCSAIMISLIMRAGEKRSSSERLRAKKAEVYQRLLAAWAGVLRQPTNVGMQSALHMEDELQTAEQQLLLWSSRSVIKHYLAYQKHETPHKAHDSAVILLIGKVLLEIRKDLGQSNVGLETGDVLELLLNHTRNSPNNTDTTLQRIPSGHRLFDNVR